MAEWNDEYQLNPIDVIPSKQRWKIQWERLERWFNRVSEIKNKGKEKPLTPYDIDILIAFCQNCFQLREWIETSNPDLTKSINVLFEQNFELKGCRDICHGYEHKEIDPFQKIGEPGDSEKLKNYYIALQHEDGIEKYNIFEFIDKCYSIWKEFIKKNL